VNRFFTCTDLIAEYRLPQHIHDQLFAEIIPLEKTGQGEPLYLEAHVDAWLTARYAVAPWRSGCGFDTTVSHIKTAGEENAFVTVAEAQRRFLSGERSIRWWYRMAKIGKIAHHRVGESILFRTDDIERFITDSRKIEDGNEPPEMPESNPVSIPAAPARRSRKKSGENKVGFKFFPR